MPKEKVDKVNPGVGEQVFRPFVDPEDPYFDDSAQTHIYDIVRSRNMHKQITPQLVSSTEKRESVVHGTHGSSSQKLN